MRRVPSQGRLLARAPYGTKAATAPPSPRNCAPLSTHAAATTSSTPPSSASVVIIGGGVAGTSLAYQLAKRGVTDVVVLEKTELTAGSTWHAAGLTTWFNPGANARNLHIDSLNLFNEFEAAGMATGFHRTGSIRMLDTPERLDEAKRQLTMSKFYGGQEWELITPEEMSALHPLMQTEGLLAGLYTAGDGHIDPTSLTNCFVKAAAEASAGAVKIMKYTPVDELHSRDDRKWDVVTPKGTIIADRIVNCGGLWADEVARKAGVYLPLIPIEHQYVITGSVSAIETLEQDHGIAELPVLRDLYGSYYLRQEKKGLLVGPYESSDTMELRTDWAAKLVASTKYSHTESYQTMSQEVRADGIPRDFGMELFGGDLERLLPHLEESMERVPTVAEAEIETVVHGPVSWSPDGNPIIGPQPGAANMWTMCGFSYGIIHAGGASAYLADWMTKGEAPYELNEFDPHRYGDWATRTFTASKVRETYGANNWVVTPHDDREAGRPSRVSTVYSELVSNGAITHNANGWETPQWFNTGGDHTDEPYQPSFYRTNWHEPVKQEVQALVNGAGVFDATQFSKYEISGAGATAFLDKRCANKLPVEGMTRLCHILAPSGKALAEMTIACVGKDRYYLVSSSSRERHDLRMFEDWLGHSLCGSDPDGAGPVVARNMTPEWGVLALAGPKAREVLQPLTDHSLSDESFPFMSCQDIFVGPSPVRAIRVSFTGELGWELHCPLSAQLPLYQALKASGAETVPETGLVDFGAYALNSLRLEKGYLNIGHDFTLDHTLVEAGLGFFAHSKAGNAKPDFIGRSAVADQKRVLADGGVLPHTHVYLTVQHGGGAGVVSAEGAPVADCAGNEALYHLRVSRVISIPAGIPT